MQTIATDGTWKTAFGPYVEGEFLAGETYDATKEIRRLGLAGARSDAAWQPVAVTESIPAKLQAFPGVTVQETGVLRPVKITEPKPGVYVFDLGQNFAGFARLKVRGPAGTKVVLRFAEVLNPDGTIYTTNLRGARATDTYVLKGEGEEVWQPRFTFHGFRYVEVTGYPGKPAEDAITGIAINSNVPLVGTFECSSPMVNRLYQNIVWTQRANFISVPTDCPQRDERLGWTGDAETFCPRGHLQRRRGGVLHQVAGRPGRRPGAGRRFPRRGPARWSISNGGVAAWADAGTICPWTIYQVYNDRRLLEKHYAAMVRWVEYCRKNSKDLLRPAAGFGDWLSIKADTPLDVIATAYFAYSTHLTADAARALGKQDDARKYDELFEQIKAGVQQGLRRARRPDQGQHADLLRDGPVVRSAAEGETGGGGAIPRRRHQVARHASFDRLRGHERVDADALGHRQHAAGLQAAAERHVPLLGLLDQAWRHEHLGALGRLDAGKGFSGPRHELVRPLFVRRGGPVDVPDGGRHRQSVAARHCFPEPDSSLSWVRASHDSIHGRDGGGVANRGRQAIRQCDHSRQFDDRRFPAK